LREKGAREASVVVKSPKTGGKSDSPPRKLERQNSQKKGGGEITWNPGAGKDDGKKGYRERDVTLTVLSRAKLEIDRKIAERGLAEVRAKLLQGRELVGGACLEYCPTV